MAKKFSDYDGIKITEVDISKNYPDDDYSPSCLIDIEENTFEKVVCIKCGEDSFEIYYTDSYETSARCLNCDTIFTVHTG